MVSCGRRNSKRLIPFIAAMLTIIYFSCTPPLPLPELGCAADNAYYEKKWEKFGAYFDKRELLFTSSFSQYSCKTKFEFNCELTILTNGGSQYGTIPVPRYAPTVSVFEPHLTGHNNKVITLDKKKMLADYKETGKVVFPKVIAGSRIRLKMAFLINNTYYHSLINHFDNPLPVRVGRFVHIHQDPKLAAYAYKALGNRYTFSTDSLAINGSTMTRTWVIKEYEPPPQVDYQEYPSITEPRVALKLLKVGCWQEEYNSKKKIISSYLSDLKSAAMRVNDDPLIVPTIKKIIASESDTLRCARKILQWIQSNILVSDDDISHTSSVLSSGKASYLQAACLCRKLFKNAGIPSEIAFVFSKEDYILDTSFLSSGYSMMPLLITTLHHRREVAYPYDVGYELGEYPLYYNDVLCILPESNKIDSLPPPQWGTNWISDRMVIDLRSSNGSHRLIREYRQHSAASKRCIFNGLDKDKLREKFEDLIKEFNPSNHLHAFSLKDFYENPDGPFSVELRFECDQIPLRSGGKNIFMLNNFLPSYFEDITPERTVDVVVHENATYIDELEIMKLPGNTMTCDIKLKELSNRLFSVKFSVSETDSSYLFQRTLQIKRGRLAKEAIGAIVNDCIELNNIKNSSIVF